MGNTPAPISHPQHPSEGSRAWFFLEFWPLLLFGGCFLLMMSIPLVMTGFLTLQAILIASGLLGSILVVLTVPRFLALFLLTLSLIAFLLQPGAFEKGTCIAIFFVLFVIIGMVWLPLKGRNKQS